MIGTDLGHDLAVIYAFLVVFGIGYNALVGFLETRKFSEGYVSDLVAVGCALTMVPFVSLAGLYPAWEMVVFVLGGFVASGLPMMVGARVRHAKARKLEQQAARLAE